MTERLYYTDAMLTSFTAVVRTSEPAGEASRVTLDRTAFYPTSGGQPFDTGRLDGRRVTDVIERDDGQVEHVIEGVLAPGARVAGEIDWDRRFDHMQQHTGQHLLSAAFDRLFGVRTESFHLGAESSTIDLAREVTPGEMDRAERLANAVVWENRPVDVRYVDDDEAARLPLRKPAAREGRLRLVEVPDFDLSACGGTHVPETGRVGIIAVSGRERFRGGSRITFVCGGRALRAHGRLRDVVADVGRRLSVGPDEIDAAVVRLQDEARVQVRTLKRLQEELAGHRAAAWRASAETIGRFRGVIRSEPGGDAAGLRAMAAAIVTEPGLVAVLVGEGEPAPIVVARSSDVDLDAGALVRQLTSELGGRGGGRPDLAQGGVAAAPDAIVEYVRRRLSAAPDEGPAR